VKILLIRNDNIGDIILTTPLFEAIKKKYPTSYLAVMCAGYSKEPLLEHPFIDKLYIYEKSKHHKGFLKKIKCWLGQIKTMLEIRAEKFDFAIGIRSSFSRSNADLVLFSGAKNRVVRLPNSNKKPFGFNFFIDETANKHEVERSFDCLKPLDVFNNNEKPLIFIPDDIKKSFLAQLQSIKYAPKEYLIFHITARIEPDKWSVAKWLELATKLSFEYKIIITGAPNSEESNTAKEFCRNQPNVYFLDTPNLKYLGYAISEAKLYIAVNGGAMHLGAAMGTPTLALLGDFILNEWYPYGCEYRYLQPTSFYCQDIEVDEVYKCATDFLHNLG
jgi:ADP-heptose:LPS heptosyltransferase